MSHSPDRDVPKQVRVRTDPADDLAYRYDAIQQARDALGQGNKTDAIVAACEHASWDRTNKQRALEYLAENASGEVVAEVARILSTPYLQLSVTVDVDAAPPE
jgi:dTDP-4-dehydrorhamnose reductase